MCQHRHGKDRESEDGQKEDADLIRHLGVTLFENLVANEHGQQKREEGPSHRQDGTSKIEHQEGTQETAKGKLDDEDQPEVEAMGLITGPRRRLTPVVIIKREDAQRRNKKERD